MGLNFDYEDGQTPLDEDEKEGLRIKTISTKGELNEFEQGNIEEALQWLLGKKFKAEDLISEGFIRGLHKKMFGDVWSWAGQLRRTNKNIGVEYQFISQDLKVLCDDVLFWIKHETYPPSELVIRFKHRLVSIHCFSNGNGRHSRLMADLIIEKIFGEQVFTWGAANLSNPSDQRKNYMEALKAADRGDIQPLVQFAYS